MLKAETHTSVVRCYDPTGAWFTFCGKYTPTAPSLSESVAVTREPEDVDCPKCLDQMAAHVTDTLEDGECTACGHPRNKHSGGGWEYGGGSCSMPRCVCLGFHADE